MQKFQAISAAYTRLVASEETDDEISTVSSPTVHCYMYMSYSNFSFNNFLGLQEYKILKSRKI